MVAFTDMSDAGVSGHLYPGTPAAAGSGPTIHLAASDGLEATSARVREAGGTVVSEPIKYPLRGRSSTRSIRNGNSIGFFEA